VWRPGQRDRNRGPLLRQELGYGRSCVRAGFEQVFATFKMKWERFHGHVGIP
jgi:hypothetical protein